MLVGWLLLAAAMQPSMVASPVAGVDAIDDETPLAIVDGHPITARDVAERLDDRLMRLRSDAYVVRRRALDEMLIERLAVREAAARGISVERLEALEVDGKTTTPDEAEIERFVAQHARPDQTGPPRETARRALIHRIRTERRERWLRELISKWHVWVRLTPPRVAIETGDSPSLGSAGAPVTIVEFIDFECSYCAREAESIDQVVREYGDRVRVVFRNYPRPAHTHARRAAEAAACAAEQGRFLAMRAMLFAHQDALDDDSLVRYAREIGLRANDFDSCFGSGRIRVAWQRDVDDAGKLGLRGTPTSFVNGRPLFGVMPFEAFARLIEEELAEREEATSAR